MCVVEAVLLGTAQDGGYPQPGCYRGCCQAARADPGPTRHPVSLGIRDRQGLHLVEVTRALETQLTLAIAPLAATPPTTPPDSRQEKVKLRSLWVTHAHLGHCDGLGLLGRETMNAQGLPLHCSACFATLVEATPAWRLLTAGGHLAPKPWEPGQPVEGGPGWTVTPLVVPHRDELSDTHALLISGPRRRLLFLPDHDSWQATLAAHATPGPREWFATLSADVVLLDGTFYRHDELPNRPQAQVPHPPVVETLELLGPRRQGDPRVVFVHLNHTNPLLVEGSEARREVEESGWEVGEEGMSWEL